MKTENISIKLKHKWGTCFQFKDLSLCEANQTLDRTFLSDGSHQGSATKIVNCHMRDEVLMAITEDYCLLGCDAM
jgi:hypothetical protein